MSDNPVVLAKDAGAVRTITLNRPDVLNACNEALLVALSRALRDAEKDAAVRCVVLTGAGRAFCSGQDLAEVAEGYSSGAMLELGSRLRNHYNPVILKLRTMEKPVIAAVNGAAAGGGAGLALACDIRIAAASASFIQAFIHVGLVPDCGNTFLLPRLIGISRAMEMAFTGRKVKADEALQTGLVNQVVPDDQLSAATADFAAKVAALPTRAIGMTKRAINAAWTTELEAQLEYEAMLQTAAGKTADHREGVTAFLEKRKPQFRGE